MKRKDDGFLLTAFQVSDCLGEEGEGSGFATRRCCSVVLSLCFIRVGSLVTNIYEDKSNLNFMKMLCDIGGWGADIIAGYVRYIEI